MLLLGIIILTQFSQLKVNSDPQTHCLQHWNELSKLSDSSFFSRCLWVPDWLENKTAFGFFWTGVSTATFLEKKQY